MPEAHSKGLSRETARPSATTLLDCKTQEPTGRAPIPTYLYQSKLLNHQSMDRDMVFPQRYVGLIPIRIASSLVLSLDNFISRCLSRR